MVDGCAKNMIQDRAEIEIGLREHGIEASTLFLNSSLLSAAVVVSSAVCVWPWAMRQTPITP
jgi:hypothetical protein